jgi:hypothetical protein
MFSVLVTLALAAGGPVAPEPSATEAVSVLLDAVQQGPVPVTWLEQHIRPASLPIARPQWYARLALSINTGQLGEALRSTPGPIAVVEGPDYTRVVLGGPELLSVVVRNATIDRFEVTSCALCDEPARFVQDLLADVQRNGSDTHRLLPGVELDISAHLAENPGLAGSQWVATLQARNHQGSELSWLLGGARVTGRRGDTVEVTYADGYRDTWTVTYTDAAWKVDYSKLPAESPLRLSAADARVWRSSTQLERAAIQRWSPSWAQVDGGLEVGSRAIGAAIDPLDGTVLVSVLDLDRVLCGVFRVDPVSQVVLERFPVPPPDPRTNIELGRWFGQWHAAHSATNRQLAMTLPGRVWMVDLKTRRARVIHRANDVVLLDWVRPVAEAAEVLAIGRANGEILLLAETGALRTRLDGEPVALRLEGDQGTAVLADGRIVTIRFDGLEPTAAPMETCCNGASDGALAAGGTGALVTCAPMCDTAAVHVDGSKMTVDGAGTAFGGASISPDGRWFTTGTRDGVLVWSITTHQPVARLETSAVRTLSWGPDSASAITVGDDGRVRWWDVDAARAEGL